MDDGRAVRRLDRRVHGALEHQACRARAAARRSSPRSCGLRRRVPGTRRVPGRAVALGDRSRLAPVAHGGRRRRATGCSTRRASASSSTSATCTSARSTSSRTEGCIPATRFRCGTGWTRSSPGSRGSIPSVVMRHEPSLLAPIACRRGVRGGRRRLPARAGGGRSRSRRSRSSASRPATAARTRCSRCRQRGAADPRAGRDRAVLHAPGAAPGRACAVVRSARARPPLVRALHARSRSSC